MAEFDIIFEDVQYREEIVDTLKNNFMVVTFEDLKVVREDEVLLLRVAKMAAAKVVTSRPLVAELPVGASAELIEFEAEQADTRLRFTAAKIKNAIMSVVDVAKKPLGVEVFYQRIKQYYGGVPSSKISVDTSTMKAMSEDVAAYRELKIERRSQGATAAMRQVENDEGKMVWVKHSQGKSPSNVAELVSALIPWLAMVESFCGVREGPAALEYLARVVDIARSNGDSKALEYDVNYRMKLSVNAHRLESREKVDYCSAVIRCLLNNYDEELLALAYAPKFEQQQIIWKSQSNPNNNNHHKMSNKRKPEYNPRPSTSLKTTVCSYPYESCPWLRERKCDFPPSQHRRSKEATSPLALPAPQSPKRRRGEPTAATSNTQS
jgi:hypothetical protein